MKLFEFLTTPGPQVWLREPPKSNTFKKKKSKSNTRNTGYHQPSSFEAWKGFDLHTLRTMYDHILWEERDLPDPSQIRPSLAYALNEAGVGDFIQDSNRKIMADALEATKESLGWHDFITMIRGHSAYPVQRIENQKQKELRPFQPDWAAVRVGDDFAPKDLTNMLPGDTKISRSWSFNDQLDNQDLDALLDLGPNENPPWVMPLYQIFTYCVEQKVRYGYVISDRELLVVRTRPMDAAHPKKDPPKRSGRRVQREEQLGESNQETLEKRDIKNGVLELASIRVGSQQEDVLTVNLALWWLHLLALKDNTVQRRYKDLADEALGRVERRLEDETSTARAENGEDNDAGAGNEGDDDAVSEGSPAISDESDGPSHQQNPNDQMYFSFRTDAPLPTVAETRSSSLGKRQRKPPSGSDSKKPRV